MGKSLEVWGKITFNFPFYLSAYITDKEYNVWGRISLDSASGGPTKTRYLGLVHYQRTKRVLRTRVVKRLMVGSFCSGF